MHYWLCLDFLCAFTCNKVTISMSKGRYITHTNYEKNDFRN